MTARQATQTGRTRRDARLSNACIRIHYSYRCSAQRPQAHIPPIRPRLNRLATIKSKPDDPAFSRSTQQPPFNGAIKVSYLLHLLPKLSNSALFLSTSSPNPCQYLPSSHFQRQSGVRPSTGLCSTYPTRCSSFTPSRGTCARNPIL